MILPFLLYLKDFFAYEVLILIGESDGDLAIFINYRAAVKAIGSLFLFMGIGAYDDGAGLSLLVKLTAGVGYERFVLMPAEHKVGLYIFTDELCPVRIKLLLHFVFSHKFTAFFFVKFIMSSNFLFARLFQKIKSINFKRYKASKKRNGKMEMFCTCSEMYNFCSL